MPLHDFILPKSDTNSTVFDFLVIFCSFYVYSLVPGVWHFFISGLYLISTIRPESKRRAFQSKVSMPSRAYTSFLLCQYVDGSIEAFVMCQCPLGLIPHFYVAACTRRRTDEEVCQCPLGLIPHFYDKDVLLMARWYCVNALSGLYLISTPYMLYVQDNILNVSMPSRAYTSFLQDGYINLYAARNAVSMPSRAYTSFLRYPFKNLGFMRFPEPVFAGIYQNILTTAVFRAC